VDAGEVVDEALRWTSSRPAGEPLFLFLHVYDPHYGYDAPAPFNRRFDEQTGADDPSYRSYFHYLRHPLDEAQLDHLVAQYDEEIAYVDHELARLSRIWSAAGRQALWVVVSDHGEELGERGSWGHAHTLWPEQLHVPWIVSGPGVRPGVEALRVGLEDVPSTVASLVGVPFAPGDGVDRAARLRGQPTGATADAPLAARFAGTSRFKTLRFRWHEPPWDLHLDLRSGARSLCQLEQDPTCQQDRAAQHPDQVEHLERDLHEWLGTPWVAEVGLSLRSDGVFVSGGVVSPRRLQVRGATQFALYPVDAQLSWSGAAEGGPRSAIRGARPAATSPVRWTGPDIGARPVVLGDADRAALEALGYLHRDPEDADGR